MINKTFKPLTNVLLGLIMILTALPLTSFANNNPEHPTNSDMPELEIGFEFEDAPEIEVGLEFENTLAFEATDDFISIAPRTGAAPSISIQPSSTTRTVGQTATFTVTASTSSGRSYRWYWRNSAGNFVPVIAHNGASGINTRTLTQTNVTMAMNGWTYQVVIRDSANRTVTSRNVTLTVTDFYSDLNWFYPLRNAASRHISCGFGSANCPQHHGIDIIRNGGNIHGERVYSAHAGQIMISGWGSNNTGNWVVIRSDVNSPTTGGRIVSRYIHLDSVSREEGRVNRAVHIGAVGATGNVVGNGHLHFDVNRHNLQNATLNTGNAMNPQRFFPNIRFTGQTSNLGM